jgi:hypothetical protein
VNTRRERDDIVDNAFSRLDQVFNDANEIVRVYVKQP